VQKQACTVDGPPVNNTEALPPYSELGDVGQEPTFPDLAKDIALQLRYTALMVRQLADRSIGIDMED
jgi:hypothetical protein